MPGRVSDHRQRNRRLSALETKEITIVSNPLLPVVLTLSVAGAGPHPTPPIACRANALDKTERARQQELLKLMRASAQSKEELADGYAFRLATDPALFQKAAEWISLERRCCPFMEFGLEWKQDDSVWVRFTGGPGVKAFIALEILGM
jgi:hypothetical protein